MPEYIREAQITVEVKERTLIVRVTVYHNITLCRVERDDMSAEEYEGTYDGTSMAYRVGPRVDAEKEAKEHVYRWLKGTKRSLRRFVS